jgi:DNA repair exonuclease SbcCD ATPase subunit
LFDATDRRKYEQHLLSARRKLESEVLDRTVELEREIAERKRVEEDLRELTGRLLRLRDLIKQNSSFVSNLSVEIQTISHLLHPPLLDEVGLGGWIAKIY